MKMVSVIIPTYKGSSQLKRAIDSAISQSYKDIEIIVVDDNDPFSEERKNTVSVMKMYDYKNIRYIQHSQNKNGAYARNTGIKLATAKYITFLDDDDFMLPNRIEAAVKFLEDNELYQGIVCGVILLQENYIIREIRYREELKLESVLCNNMALGSGSNIFLRKEVLDDINGFDTSFIRHQDREFMIRVLRKAKIGFLPQMGIVKGENGTSNVPNYNSFKSTKEYFENVFKNEIEGLSNNNKKRYLEDKNWWLLWTALEGNNLQQIQEAKRGLENVRRLSFLERLRIWLKIHNQAKMLEAIKKMKFFIVRKKLSKNMYLMYRGIF